MKCNDSPQFMVFYVRAVLMFKRYLSELNFPSWMITLWLFCLQFYSFGRYLFASRYFHFSVHVIYLDSPEHSFGMLCFPYFSIFDRLYVGIVSFKIMIGEYKIKPTIIRMFSREDSVCVFN